MRWAFSVRWRLPKLHLGIALLASAFSVAEPSAQEHTLQDFVNDADALIVARIFSKEAVQMKVQTRQPSDRIATSTGISTKFGIAVSEDFFRKF